MAKLRFDIGDLPEMKTVASLYPRGSKLMMKMGWKGGALGKTAQGVLEVPDMDTILQKARVAGDKMQKKGADSRRGSVSSGRRGSVVSVTSSATMDLLASVFNNDDCDRIATRTTAAATVVEPARHSAERPPAMPVYIMDGEGCSFVMPTEKVPLVIGKKGAMITSLQEKHMVRITLPGREQQDQGTVTITPQAEGNANGAKNAIVELVGPIKHLVAIPQASPGSSGEGSSTKGPGMVSFTIAPDKGSIIIGKGGSTLKSLTERHGVTIKLPGKDFKGSKAMVLISGTNPRAALSAITDLVGEVCDVNWFQEAKATAREGGKGGKDWAGRGSNKGDKGGKVSDKWVNSSKGSKDFSKGGKDSSKGGKDSNTWTNDSNIGDNDSNKGGKESSKGGGNSNKGGKDASSHGGKGSWKGGGGRGGWSHNSGSSQWRKPEEKATQLETLQSQKEKLKRMIEERESELRQNKQRKVTI